MILGSFLGVGPTLKLYACNVHRVPYYVDVDKVKELNNIFNV